MLALRGPGEVIGEMSTVDGAPRSASAVAVDEVEATVAPASALTAALDRDPAASRALLALLAGRLREADRGRIELATLDSLARVARRLAELAERFGEPGAGGVHVALPLSQEELASWCGASRESTVKALRVLREVGCLATGRRTVTVLDAAALRRHAAL